MSLRTGSRGQPVLVMSAIMGLWVAGRGLCWPGPALSEPYPRSPIRLVQAGTGVGVARLAVAGGACAGPGAGFVAGGRRPAAVIGGAGVGVGPGLAATGGARGEASGGAPISPGLAASHPMLLMAAVSRRPLPGALQQAQARRLAPPGFAALPGAGVAPLPPEPPGTSAPATRRWSGDAWLMLRRGGDGAALASGLPTYGAAQAGGVLRYNLAPGSGFRPTVFALAYGALNGSGEREVGLGLSARPVPGLPLRVMAGGRLSHFTTGADHLRPAVTLVTELYPFALPAGARGEFYAQGGYVGGASATPFVDSQLLLNRRLARLGPLALEAGGGVWGGAQKGANRLDLGPGASLRLSDGHLGGRLSFDWRFRVSGNALPDSGPVLTMAAGF